VTVIMKSRSVDTGGNMYGKEKLMIVQNKIIVVSGAGSGMGRELVLLLLKKGARVAAVDINPDTLNETLELAGDTKVNVSAHVLDITNKEAVFALPEKVISHHGAVDGIINNAGIIQPFVLVNDLKFDDIERVLNINLYGVIYMTKAFLPHLLKRPEGHIINISSMGGFLPVPGQSIYGASKAAVKLLTEGLNSELLNTNVRVTVVFPGAIDTNIAANSGVGIGMEQDAESSSIPTTPADKAAEIIVDGIEKDSYRVLVGSDAKLMDFLVRLNPKGAAKIIYKQMASLLPK
jgi:short-subunit dehydrogenase